MPEYKNDKQQKEKPKIEETINLDICFKRSASMQKLYFSFDYIIFVWES